MLGGTGLVIDGSLEVRVAHDENHKIEWNFSSSSAYLVLDHPHHPSGGL